MLPALLLTAGLGTRIHPLSSVRAKPSMPVAGEPLVRRILRWLAAGGVTNVVLNLHHKPETICAVVGDGGDLGVRARYSWEPLLLGSAGGPRLALPLLASDRFFIVNGDTLTDLDPGPLERAHEQSGASVTLAVIPNTAPDHYGGALVEADGTISGFAGPGSGRQTWLFIGVQVAEARTFGSLMPGEPAESVASLYPALIRRHPGSVRAFTCHASFSDIGTVADYLATSLALAGQEAAAAGTRAGTRLAGQRCGIGASARVTRSVLWDDVSVGDGAELTECVVGDGVRVPQGARFARSALVRAAGIAPGPGETVVGDVLVVPFPGNGVPPGDRASSS